MVPRKRLVPKNAPQRQPFFGMKTQNIPSEAKLVGGLLLMLAVLYVFQVVSQPSFLKSQANAITGLVVAETEKQSEPTASTTTTTAPATAPATAAATSQPAASFPVSIKIVSPQKGSALSPGFDLKVEFSSQAITCYYQVKDSGATIWDRRMKPCRETITVEPGYCKTVGKDTCFVRVEAYSGDGSTGAIDEAYYSIK